ncbi:uncharacterized protein LOC144711206 [Wolffia australiana]
MDDPREEGKQPPLSSSSSRLQQSPSSSSSSSSSTATSPANDDQPHSNGRSTAMDGQSQLPMMGDERVYRGQTQLLHFAESLGQRLLKGKSVISAQGLGQPSSKEKSTAGIAMDEELPLQKLYLGEGLGQLSSKEKAAGEDEIKWQKTHLPDEPKLTDDDKSQPLSKGNEVVNQGQPNLPGVPEKTSPKRKAENDRSPRKLHLAEGFGQRSLKGRLLMMEFEDEQSQRNKTFLAEDLNRPSSKENIVKMEVEDEQRQREKAHFPKDLRRPSSKENTVMMEVKDEEMQRMKTRLPEDLGRPSSKENIIMMEVDDEERQRNKTQLPEDLGRPSSKGDIVLMEVDGEERQRNKTHLSEDQGRPLLKREEVMMNFQDDVRESQGFHLLEGSLRASPKGKPTLKVQEQDNHKIDEEEDGDDDEDDDEDDDDDEDEDDEEEEAREPRRRRGEDPFTLYKYLNQELYRGLTSFWERQRRDVITFVDFKYMQQPLAQVRNITKADGTGRVIGLETLLVLSRACGLFIGELTFQSWVHALKSQRTTLERRDVAEAIASNLPFFFLSQVVPREIAAPSPQPGLSPKRWHRGSRPLPLSRFAPTPPPPRTLPPVPRFSEKARPSTYSSS